MDKHKRLEQFDVEVVITMNQFTKMMEQVCQLLCENLGLIQQNSLEKKAKNK